MVVYGESLKWERLLDNWDYLAIDCFIVAGKHASLGFYTEFEIVKLVLILARYTYLGQNTIETAFFNSGHGDIVGSNALSKVL